MNTDPIQQEAERLEALAASFFKALQARHAGRYDAARDALEGILRQEPRLPEPRMELGRLCLDADQLADAEVHTRQALEALESGGQWTDDLPEAVVQSVCHAQLAEILRRRADEDDVIFGDPKAFHALLAESQRHFAEAAKLDPTDATSDYYAFFIGVPGGEVTI